MDLGELDLGGNEALTVTKQEQIASPSWQCSALHCTNCRGKRPDLSFFKFPKDEERCKKWLMNCGRHDLLSMPLKLTSTKFLCSDHFEDSEFTCDKRNQLRQLKAVPTIFYLPIPPSGLLSKPTAPRDYSKQRKIIVVQIIEPNVSATVNQRPQNQLPSSPPQSSSDLESRTKTTALSGYIKRPYVRHCAAINCSNRSDQQTDIPFFRFPLEEERCKRWLINCGRRDLLNKSPKVLSQSRALCANHFEDSEFGTGLRQRLKHHTAIPTIFNASVPSDNNLSNPNPENVNKEQQGMMDQSTPGSVVDHLNHESISLQSQSTHIPAGDKANVRTDKRPHQSRFCSAKNCKNTRRKKPDLGFFAFPLDKEKCRKWVINCGRQDLLKISPQILNAKHVLCAEHFQEVDFHSNRKNCLRRHWAVPTIFGKSESGSGLKSSPLGKESRLEENQNHQQSALGPSSIPSESDTKKTKAVLKKRKRRDRKGCSAQHCRNMKDARPDLAFYKFPKDINRCKKWIINCGRLDLLRKTPEAVSLENTLCSDHFEVSEFTSTNDEKTCLKFTKAVPTIFPAPLSYSESSAKTNKSVSKLNRDKVPVGKVQWCSSIYCKNSNVRRPGLAFFPFPMDEARCRRWVINCRRGDLMNESPQAIISLGNVLCSDHFEASEFTSGEKNQLKHHEAVPTIFCVPSPPKTFQCSPPLSTAKKQSKDVVPAVTKQETHGEELDCYSPSSPPQTSSHLDSSAKTEDPASASKTGRCDFKCQWCSALNCKNSRHKRPDLSFFRFPNDKERSRKWVINCQRQDLLNKSPQALFSGNVLCSDHFEDSEFTGKKRNRLIRFNAVPTLFDLPDFSPSSFSSQLQSIKRRKRHLQEENNPDLDELPSWSLKTSGQLNALTKMKKTMLSTFKKGKKNQQNQHCSALNCKNARHTRPDLTFFRFPMDKERCKTWVLNCQRRDLLKKSSKTLFSANVLCSDHFEDSEFTNSKRRLLKRKTAVPTVFDVPNTKSAGRLQWSRGKTRKVAVPSIAELLASMADNHDSQPSPSSSQTEDDYEMPSAKEELYSPDDEEEEEVDTDDDDDDAGSSYKPTSSSRPSKRASQVAVADCGDGDPQAVKRQRTASARKAAFSDDERAATKLKSKTRSQTVKLRSSRRKAKSLTQHNTEEEIELIKSLSEKYLLPDSFKAFCKQLEGSQDKGKRRRNTQYMKEEESE